MVVWQHVANTNMLFYNVQAVSWLPYEVLDQTSPESFRRILNRVISSVWTKRAENVIHCTDGGVVNSSNSGTRRFTLDRSTRFGR